MSKAVAFSRLEDIDLGGDGGNLRFAFAALDQGNVRLPTFANHCSTHSCRYYCWTVAARILRRNAGSFVGGVLHI
jgi:hypothetical protein